MKIQSKVVALIIVIITLFSLAACSGGDVASNDLPVYPGATELQEGASNIGDTLAQNMEQDAAMRQALGGLKGKIEQKAYQLPAETTWEQIKSFYEKELSAAGWQNGMGGLTNSFIDVNALMETANQGNDLFQTSLWSKDKQTLTVLMITDPVDPTQKQLVMSISTQ